MLKMKYRLKSIQKNIHLYWGLPHIWVLFIVSVLAISACIVSISCKENAPYISSLFSNIFAGLITGVVICLISTLKSSNIYKSECLIKWLEELHKECLEFIEMYRKLCSYKPEDFDNIDELYNYIYDTLCCGNNVSLIISQGQFNKSLPFNSCKYCKRKFDFDVIEVMENNSALRDIVMQIDTSNITHKQLADLFNDMEHQIFVLNGNILKRIDELKAKQKALNISIG